MDTPQASNANGQLTPEEREHMVRVLEASREALIAAIGGLTPAQWTFKPAEDVWSIAECCDHIGGTELLFMKMITRRLIEDRDRAAAVQGKEKMLRKAIPNRSHRVKVPVEIKPYGHTESPEAFAEAFRATRTVAIEYAKTTDDPLHWRVSPHFVLGDFDGAQWLEIVAEHCDRHRQQIEEVKAAPGYPAAG